MAFINGLSFDKLGIIIATWPRLGFVQISLSHFFFMVIEVYAIILGGIDTSVRPFPKPLGEVSGRSMECFVLLGTVLLGVCTLGPPERLAPQFAHLRSLSGNVWACHGVLRAASWTGQTPTMKTRLIFSVSP